MMQQQPTPDVAPAPTPAPAPPPAPVQAPTPRPGDLAPVAAAGGPATAQQMLRAARAQRDELQEQLRGLEEKRRDLSNRLLVETLDDTDRAGLQKRIGEIDARILDVEKQIAQSDLLVAQAAAVPGAVQEPPWPPPGEDEEEAVFATLGITTPLWLAVIWIMRRRWKRVGAGAAPKDLGTQLTRVEQAVESIALEVERIGEAQRFTARVLAEREDARALGAGAAEPVQVRQREGAPERAR